MNIILSRKGFDSQYGGKPSPILPDGQLVPLPIPSRHDKFTLSDINFPKIDIHKLAADLSRGRYGANTRVHLDPDLSREPSSRIPGWRPALGQTGNAQSHLNSEGVGKNDLFLFFGWFRMVECRNGVWRYISKAPDLHIIFGWLEVGDVLPIVQDRSGCLKRYPWIADHPHVSDPKQYNDPRNTLYIAAQRSRLTQRRGPGGGRFEKFHEHLVLTRPGSSRSTWSLPGWFMPTDHRVPLSYHRNTALWKRAGNKVTLKSVAKGQEFVLHANSYPTVKVNNWLERMFEVRR